MTCGDVLVSICAQHVQDAACVRVQSFCSGGVGGYWLGSDSVVGGYSLKGLCLSCVGQWRVSDGLAAQVGRDNRGMYVDTHTQTHTHTHTHVHKHKHTRTHTHTHTHAHTDTRTHTHTHTHTHNTLMCVLHGCVLCRWCNVLLPPLSPTSSLSHFLSLPPPLSPTSSLSHLPSLSHFLSLPLCVCRRVSNFSPPMMVAQWSSRPRSLCTSRTSLGRTS